MFKSFLPLVSLFFISSSFGADLSDQIRRQGKDLVGTNYSKARLTVMRQGWKPYIPDALDDPHAVKSYPEIECGTGNHAACAGQFYKGDVEAGPWLELSIKVIDIDTNQLIVTSVSILK